LSLIPVQKPRICTGRPGVSKIVDEIKLMEQNRNQSLNSQSGLVTWYNHAT
jgi:hypothetical protein